jgi:predicted RNA-binding protein YlqC (UPF0109 family)
MSRDDQAMKELLLTIVKPLVGNPQAIVITNQQGHAVVLELHVDPSDMAR